MGVLGRLFGGDKDTLQFKRDVCLTTAAGEAQQQDNPEIEYLQMMAKIGYLTVDENVIRWLFDHPQFHPLIPQLAPVNRTTILTDKQADINRLDYEITSTWLKLTMSPDDYEAGAPEMLQGFRPFANNIVNDAIGGKKLVALTQMVKRIEIETDKKKGWIR